MINGEAYLHPSIANGSLIETVLKAQRDTRVSASLKNLVNKILKVSTEV